MPIRLLHEVNELQFDYLKSVTGGLDRNAVLEDLMEEFGTDVWNFAYFLTGRAELADDIAQDVFVIVYEKLYSFRGESSVKTWLLTITRNKARDAMRSAWIRRVSLLPAWSSRETHPSAEREVMDRMMTDDIWTKVMELPRKLREVLLLHTHHGIPLKEIAGLLGIPEGTVKSRLHRSRTAVNRMLSHEEREGESR
jgi:RNA polymerase sigma-70 factor (ECF subfamily)